MHVLTVVGARPQFIKASPVSRALARQGIREQVVHTGQHYDLNMSDIFFKALGLQPPQYHLGVGSGSHGAQTGRMLAEIEKIFLDARPDAVVVYGDTNSTLAGALAAAKLHVPVVHVEAGLRSFNRRMPEEVNRVLTDHISTLLFCPTATAVHHLEREGITEGVHLVGDVMKDALDYWRVHRPAGGAVLEDMNLRQGDYYLVTMHRAENVDDAGRFDAILEALNVLESPVIFPVHPRTRKALAERGRPLRSHVRLIEPVGYLEVLELVGHARAVLTDSGGLQKEAYMLGVPCVTLRDETEWVETVEAGWNILAGADTRAILGAVARVSSPPERPALFGDGHASDRIAAIMRASIDAGPREPVGLA